PIGSPGRRPVRAVRRDRREPRHVVSRDARRAEPTAPRAPRGADRVRSRLSGRDLRGLRDGDQRPTPRAAARHHDVPAAYATFPDGAALWLEPWRARAFPVVKDLVVDRSAFDRVIAAGGFITARTGSAPEA